MDTTAGLVLAVDVGGTKLETALVDAGGRLVTGSRHRRPTGPTRSPAEVTQALGDAVRSSLAAADRPVLAAGVGSAGPLDGAGGTVSPLNLPLLAGYPLREVVERASGLPAVVRLDGTCIALAEHWLGATRGARTSMGVVVSTGIGGGVVVDDRLVTGRSGNAGHIGQVHVAVEPGEEGHGTTLEAAASGPSTVRWARRRGWTGRSGEDLAAALRAGDPVADEATRRSARLVGQAVAGVATLLELESVAVGGGFVAVRHDYVDLVRASVREHAVHEYARRVEVGVSALRGEGPLLGAAALRHRADLLGAPPARPLPV
ncbi:ROK family protein [Pseudokineococcus basanitobsidens]|uniref:ROK family protein n=1 Tax=Pseudokineococcus basanitobsidens TaxID=1926649 RepID=A0ABU8RLU9_9ACTN